jgi:pimeloyl-ACP methyl ester carboxylesterase
MNEYPMFVPWADGDHLAAVLTVPDSPPRGVVLLLQGLGPPRSHRYQLWTKTARALAERGLASVRLDYPQVGDSTGVLHGTLDDPPVSETIAVATAAMRATGVTALAAVGNCMGGRTALRLQGGVGDLHAIGVILTGDPTKYLGRRGRPGSRRGLWQRLLRKIRRMRTAKGDAGGIRWIPDVPKTLASSELLLMYAGPQQTSSVLERAFSALAARTTGARTAYRFIPAPMTNRFELEIPVQQRVVESVVDWLDGAMPARAVDRPDAGRGVETVP